METHGFKDGRGGIERRVEALCLFGRILGVDVDVQESTVFRLHDCKGGLGHEKMVARDDDFGVAAERFFLNPFDKVSDSLRGAAKDGLVIGSFRRLFGLDAASFVKKSSGEVRVDGRDGHREGLIAYGV